MTSLRSLRQTTGVVAVAALALAACGGSSESGGASELPSAAAAANVTEIDPAADLATNLLPDLVVDNLNDDNKVNLRNYGVGDKPVLLWMWAPH